MRVNVLLSGGDDDIDTPIIEPDLLRSNSAHPIKNHLYAYKVSALHPGMLFVEQGNAFAYESVWRDFFDGLGDHLGVGEDSGGGINCDISIGESTSELGGRRVLRWIGD